MYFSQLGLIVTLFIVLSTVQAVPIANKRIVLSTGATINSSEAKLQPLKRKGQELPKRRFKLEPGMSTVSTPDGTVAHKRSERDLDNDHVKRVIVEGPNGHLVTPAPVGPSGLEPMKRYIIEEPNGTTVLPTPGAGGVVPM